MGYSIVGIDLGTSTTVVRVKNYDTDGTRTQTKVLHDVNGEDSFATVIVRLEDGLSYYGSEAELWAERQLPGETVFRNFKMDLISPDEGKRDEARELVVEYLEFIKREIGKQQYDVDLRDEKIVAVSVPAKWPRDVRDFMREAVVRAEIVKDPEKVRIVDEPTAASRAVLTARLPDLLRAGILDTGSFNVMMVDMGAGTTDLVVFRLEIAEDGRMSVDSAVCYPPVGNPNLCGGREIDARLAEYVISACGESAERKRTRLEYALKKAKENWLSPSLRKGVPYDFKEAFAFSGSEYRALQPMDRQTFERLTADHWANWRTLVEEAIETARERIGICSDDIDLLVLTGGHSAWYCVDELFSSRTLESAGPLTFAKLRREPERILCETNRNVTVANGLALDDSLLPFVNTTVNKYVLRMTAPGGEKYDQTVAEANETLPCTRTLDFACDVKEAAPRTAVPIAVELLYEGADGAMRTAVLASVGVEPPDNLTSGVPVRLIVRMRVEIDVDYRVYAIGRATAVKVDDGKLVGIPKLTEIEFFI